MKDVKCPYCGHEQDIVHDDGYGYEEDRVFEQECGSCEKVFAYDTSISFYHTAWKADCLNGGEHDWAPARCFPNYWPDRKRCKLCDKVEEGEMRDPEVVHAEMGFSDKEQSGGSR